MLDHNDVTNQLCRQLQRVKDYRKALEALYKVTDFKDELRPFKLELHNLRADLGQLVAQIVESGGSINLALFKEEDTNGTS